MEFYGILHPHEADEFSAELEPRGAALDLSVGFLGRGRYPPHALHSEGHQDSMGLCLFLALNERLGVGGCDIIILDDVIMSVDAEHRRGVGRLLRSHFSNKQLFITTHDRTWARQLHSDSIVSREGLVEFPRWSIDGGPVIDANRDMWEMINADLAQGNVSEAAQHLRRGGEQFLESVCDALRAKVTYRSDGRWEFGDWLTGATAVYKAWLRKAKDSASSWNDAERLDELVRLGNIRAQVYERSSAEQWAIDPHIHYNRWIELNPSEFEEVVDAFKDLFQLFVCPDCGRHLEVTMADRAPASLGCACGRRNWSLRTR